MGVFLGASVSVRASYVYMSRHLTPKNITPTALAAAQLIAATGWTLLALAANPGAAPHFAPGPWAALAILGVFGTVQPVAGVHPEAANRQGYGTRE